MTVADRAARIAELGYAYVEQPKRPVVRCNLCGHDRAVVISHVDRYGYPADASSCLRCGLTFLDPVMTREAYARFYQGVYRPLVSAYHGRTIDARSIQGEQREYARDRGDLLAPYLDGRRSLLDIGGSTGVVAHVLAERFGLVAAVLDPAPLELDEAGRLGLETIASFAEDYDPAGRQFDVVAMCQTVDHLLDISSTLALVRRVLREDGVFYADIVDWRAAYLRNRSIESAVKVDHPYYLTEPTFEAYLARHGFEVLRKDYARDHLHVGYVCRPGDRIETLPDLRWVHEQFREIRWIQNDRIA